MFEESLYTLYHIHYNVDSDKASYHNRAVKRGEHMPTNEKEYNGFLLDQIELIERLEIVIESGDIDAVKNSLHSKGNLLSANFIRNRQ